MSDSFCIYPWLHTHFGPDGDVSLCCFASATPDPELADEDGRRFNLQDRSFGEIWNSEALRRVRMKMIQGQQVKECSHCYHKEAVGGQSPRQLANNEWVQRHPRREEYKERVMASSRNGYRVEEGLAYLDARPGNACNLGCRMCGGLSSSFLAKDAVHSTWGAARGAPVDEVKVAVRRRGGDRFGDGRPWYRQEEVLNHELMGDPQSLEKVYLAGGEPLFNKTVAAMIRHLTEAGAAPGIDLTFSTNLTVWNEDFVASLEPFRSVRFMSSVDGEGSTYDYLRYPARWETVVENLQHLQRFPFVAVDLTPTVQNANALTITDLMRYAEFVDVPYSLATLYGPDHLSIHALPRRAREVAVERLQAFMRRSRQAQRNSYLVDTVGTLLRDFAQPSPRPYGELMRHFNLFTNDLDADRGQSLEQACPELWGFLQEDPDYTWTDERTYVPADTSAA